MSAARIVILTLALICAIGLAVVVRNMMVAKRPPVATAQAKAPPAIEMVRVLVAKRDLAIGTRLSAADMGWQNWPAENLNPLFYTDGAHAAPAPATPTAKAAATAVKAVQMLSGSAALDSLVGTIVHDPIASGEPIQKSKIVPGGDGGYLAVVLPHGMQALGVPIKSDGSAGGFITPGDRVDVIQSREIDAPGGQSRIRVTNPVVLNVKVLAIDQTTKLKDDTNTIVGAVATLEVSSESAEALVEAIAQGDLHLALRSYADVNAPSGVAQPRRRQDQQQSQTVKVFSQGDTVEQAVTR